MYQIGKKNSVEMENPIAMNQTGKNSDQDGESDDDESMGKENQITMN
jgi:hypothetical protein